MKTGATPAQIEVAAIQDFEDHNDWRALSWSNAQQATREEFMAAWEYNAHCLVPEDKRIIDIADLKKLRDAFDAFIHEWGYDDGDLEFQNEIDALIRGCAP